jgi:hypothetical protein
MIKSRWIEIMEKTLLQQEAENGERSGRTSRVGFALVAKAVVAQEKRKHLEEPLQDRDKKDERAVDSFIDTQNPGVKVDQEGSSLENEEDDAKEGFQSFSPEHQESGQDNDVESVNS